MLTSDPRDGAAPSALARRLWFLEQLEPVSHVTPCAVRLRGDLRLEALDAAFADLLAEYAALRTRCVDVAGTPTVVAVSQQPGPVRRSTASGADDLPRLLDEVIADLNAPAAPAAAAGLVVGPDPDDYLLLVVVHQSVADPAGVAALMAALGRHYTRRVGYQHGCDRSPVPLLGDRPPAEGAPLADWLDTLLATPPHDPPGARSRPAVWRAAGDTVPFASAPLSAADDKTAAIAVAVAHTALARHSGRWHGTLGLRRQGRVVPVPVRLEPGLPFDDAVDSLLPLLDPGPAADAELLAASIADKQDLSRNPLFGVLVDLVDRPAVCFGPLDVEHVPVPAPATRFDLVIRLIRDPDGGTTGELEYSKALLGVEAARRLAGHLANLLAAAAEDPRRRLDQLPMLPSAEFATVLPGLPVTGPPTGRNVTEMVAAQAARQPDRTAVECGDERLTYAELTQRADAIAAHLLRLNVGTGDLVAVALPRGVELLATLLGVLRAGAAYVPLDPDHPADRLRHILTDAGARVIVTTATTRDSLPVVPGRVVTLAEITSVADASADYPQVRAGDPAYMIYTSGSTGLPKGVMVPHGALTNFLLSMAERPGIDPGAVFPAVTTVSFDIAALELFLPLLVGGRVVVAVQAEAREPERLSALLSRTGARVMQATPTTWRLLLDAGWTPPPGFTALCGGEKLPQRLAERLCALGVRLWDVYGPTETTVWSSVSLIEDGAVRGFWPVAATSLAVLDERMQPTPLGAVGELYIGGAGVAYGYHGLGALTAQRFVPDPYGTVSGGRLYRTGDLARRHPDGHIEILGRTDHQVKIRGFRVELGEVEAVLAGHPGVRAAVVRAVPTAGDDVRLVGYVRPDGDVTPSHHELHVHCARQLPPYMIPALFVTVDAFPTTPNGKIDRNALPDPVPAELPSSPGRQPTTPHEQLIARVFADVLTLPAVGADDDFFAIGGHSLLATRAMSRVRAELDVELPVSALFEARTVAELARRVGAAGRAVAPIAPAAGDDGPAPLSYAQRRLWFLDQLTPGGCEYLEPCTVTFTGDLDLAALERAVSQLVARHPILRTRYLVGPDGDPVQVVDPPAAAPLVVEPGDPQRVLAEELATGFDLATEPPVRMRLLRTAPDRHVLLLVLHHIATDDHSMRILRHDLGELYHGRSLPSLPLRYADYARWQRAQLTGPALRGRLDFWRETLRGLEPVTLPADRPRPAVRDATGSSVHLRIPAALVERLVGVADSQGATAFMTYLAGFFATLARFTGRDDLAVGVPVAGRSRPELEPLVGFFVNTIVLRADLGGRPDFVALLAAVRDRAVAAYAHDDLPFELLVADLAPERDLSRNPLVQVLFALHEEPSPIEFDRTDAPARFDLACHLFRTPQGHLDGRIDYATALFDRDTVAEFAEHYLRLLQEVAADPARAIDELVPAVSAQAGAHALGAPMAPVAPPLVHELIAARAATDPEAVAVRAGSRFVTFGELERSANRLAHDLRRLGVRRGDLVPVRMPRTPELVAALLGVLKAGAAYVPADPAHPVERWIRLLSVTGATVVISEAGSVERPGVTVLDPTDPAPADDPVAPAASVTGDDLAYVVYTSGSTGVPKGVMITHGGLASYTGWALDALPVGDLGAPLHTSLAFDLTLTALWPVLAAGAPVTLVSDRGSGVEDLAELLTERRVDFVKLTPTHTDLLADLVAPTELANAGCLVVGGEQLRGEYLADWRQHAPDLPVLNSYGPTEVTVACCVHTTRAGDLGPGPVPIGRPLPGVRLHVLTDALRPVPRGAVGELFVGGPGVARGYLGAPALTADRFVPDPFAPEPGGARLYRTGDLVRWRRDGTLEFIGRRDQQAKIRGYRVEPAEVEAALTAHPQVRAAAVVTAEREPGRRHLAAHVVLAEPAPTLAELRDHLTARLPDYLVPTHWAVHEALPLTGNGKVDRLALPTASTLADVTSGHPPRTATEEVVAGMWRRLLGVPEVGVHDNFFTLGGESMLATRLVAQLRRHFGVPVSVRDVFAGPSVAAIAAVIDSGTAPMGTPAGPDHEDGLQLLPRAGSGPAPLSFAQRRLWFLDQLHPGGVEYLVTTVLRLHGRLDPARLAAALSDLVRRHEVLRTRYLAGPDGDPVQVVDPARPVRLTVETVEPRRMIAEELGTPLDLATGPVWRARLTQVADDEHVLVLVIHHIATDGFSTGVIAEELAAALRGQPRPSLPLQYGDYASWQHGRAVGDGFDRELAYWTDRLSGLNPTELPADRPRPAVRDTSGATLRFTMPRHVAEALGALARVHGATPAMALMAGFFALLARYTGGDDLAVGTPVSGRFGARLDALVGLFVNTVVVRVEVGDDPTYADLVRRVRDVTVDAYAHSELPYERVVEHLAPRRDLSRNPLFQIMFATREANGAARFTVPGLTATSEPVPGRTSKFDLTLELTYDGSGGCTGEIEYSTALFDPATVERLADHYLRLLAAAARRPDTRLSRLAMLAPAERRTLLLTGADTGPADDRQLPELVAAQMARTPDALAVEQGDIRLTYRSLDARVERLARRLRAANVGRDDVVAVCLPRCPDLVVALLAVHRAGAAFQPLDPGQPADRLAWLVADTGARAVIGTAVTTGFLATGLQRAVVVVALDADHGVIDAVAGGTVDDLPVATDPDALAYVIHTSGSTGRPKGVAVPHRGIRNRVAWAVERFGFSATDRMLHKTPITFDAAVWEILAPLVSGGTVVLAPPQAERDPDLLVEVAARHGVTVLQAVPSLWRPLAEEPGLARCDGLRLLFSAGEPLPTALAHRLAERLPGALLVNTYGPTECSIDVTAWPVEPTPAEAAGSHVPIGAPIHHTRAVVLDARGELVPVGVPGELHVGGAGLARGYLGRPGLTARQFVPDPYGPPGARLYRTGDVVRLLADGRLEFLGRNDDQVKIRGVRVEPGEAEAALLDHPDVSAAAVTARPGPDGTTRLVGHVVVAAGAAFEPRALREHLLARLPEPYVPAVFVRLDRLPLTSSGKVDRRALPEPGTARSDGVEAVAPRTPLEKIVAESWADVLELDEVGVLDDFFLLGGHSLLAAKVANRLRAALGVDVGVRTIFETTTVHALALRLADQLGGAAEEVAPITAAEHDGPVPLSFAQQRLWFLDRLSPGSHEYHLTWALRLRGPLDEEAFDTALSGLFARHAVLRTRYPVDASGVSYQQVDPSPPVFPKVSELCAGEAADLLAAVRALAEQPFDLAAAPPVAVHLLRVAADDHVFVLVLHHIAGDAWSETILAHDLAELYRAALEGRPPALVAQPVRYADYAVWQRDRMAGDRLQQQLAHWRERLTGLHPVELPTDRPRPALRDGRGAAVEFTLPAEVTAPLLDLGQRHGATAFMTFLAAFLAVLTRYVRTEELCVGTPVAGRDRPELEDLVGFFVNTVVLRVDTAGDPTFRELLGRVRAVALDAFEHGELPFERIIEELSPQRDRSRTPLVDVMFEVQPAASGSPDLPGLAVTRLVPKRTTAKFDLSLTLVANPDGSYRGEIEYATALFDEATVRRLAGHLRTITESAGATPDIAVARLDVLTGAELAQLRQWAGRSAEPEAGTLGEAFLAQVAADPRALAVSTPTGRLTYAELAAQSAALADRLRDAGVGPESPVAVGLDRSAESVVVLLAVLRAGGAYVPIDLEQPAGRLAQILTDLRPTVVVTDTRLRSRLDPVCPVDSRMLLMDDPDAPEPSPLSPPPVVHPDQVAYVLYTSGSSGTPKGVAITHRAFLRHCRVIAGSYDIRAGDRVVQLAALTFDVAMDQIAAPLLAGAAVVMLGPERFWSPGELPDRLAAAQVTHMEITPAYYREVMSSVRPGDPRLAGLRVMNVGSDVVTYDDARSWFATGLPGRFLNTYGPTEATITSVVHEVSSGDGADVPGRTALPIGRPVAATRAYVLDEHLAPVPVGVAGELHLAGDRLARGYLHRPGLTARSFVPDPYGAPGERLYRTGDLARLRPDGTIEFLGRIDSQVKVRGYRIELGEVEATLAQHPDVRACAVLAPEAVAGGRELVGYVVGHPGRTCSPAGLQRFLRTRLTEYMVPRRWVMLDHLPLTASGKVNRRALPMPDPDGAGSPDEQVPPRDEVEAAIAEIWSAVLGTTRFGVFDDFFELGGHSLLATRVATRLAHTFDLDVPLSLLFEFTTVAAQSAALAELAEEADDD